MTPNQKQILSGLLGAVLTATTLTAVKMGLDVQATDCIDQPPAIVVTVIMPTATLTPEPTATATELPPILVTATAMAEAGDLLPTATVQP